MLKSHSRSKIQFPNLVKTEIAPLNPSTKEKSSKFLDNKAMVKCTDLDNFFFFEIKLPKSEDEICSKEGFSNCDLCQMF